LHNYVIKIIALLSREITQRAIETGLIDAIMRRYRPIEGTKIDEEENAVDEALKLDHFLYPFIVLAASLLAGSLLLIIEMKHKST